MRALVEGIREGGQLIANQIIVIRRAECLLSVDAKTFSLICRLRQLAQNPSIGLVLMSTNLWQEFHGISAGLEPLIFSTRQITTAGLASRLEIDLGSTGTEKVPFRRFLDFTCSIVRSQMNELPLVVDFMKKYYPIFMATDKEGRRNPQWFCASFNY